MCYAARYTFITNYYEESDAPVLEHFGVKHLLDEKK